MRKSNKFTDCRPRFECLETRNLLAGNVTSNFAGGLLTLTGDAAGNNIQVSQLANGEWQVKGIGTKIDGGNSPEAFPGVTDISVDLVAGNDVLKVQNGTLSGQLNVQYTPGVQGSKNTQLANLRMFGFDIEQESTGNNVVFATNVSLGSGPCDVVTGNGKDVVTENNVSAFVLAITTNGGNDAVTVTKCSGFDGIDVETGDGNDAATVTNSHCDTEIKIVTGENPTDGNDSVYFSGLNAGSLFVDDQYGTNSVVGKNSTTGATIDIDLDFGNDTVVLSGLHTGDALLVSMQSGKNVATVTNCTCGNELYFQGIGPASTSRNVITVTNCSTEQQFSMDLSDGSDVVTVNNVSAAVDSYFNGYGGNNLISINKMTIDGTYQFTTGDGNDTLTAMNVVTGEPTINLGNGNNVISLQTWKNVGTSDYSIATGSGRDVISIIHCSSTLESLYVNAGDGTNTCVIASCQIAGAIGYTGGDGRDYLTMTNSSGSVINVFTGDDTDVVSLASVSTPGGLNVDMGPGNYDTLVVTNCSSPSADLEGGGNTGDTLVKTHNHFTALTVNGFPIVIG